MSIDDDILDVLRAVPNLNVHDGFVDTDETEKVIAVDLPYVVFTSTPGYDRTRRFGGAAGGRVTEFSIRGVGEDREQAKFVLDRARGALSGRRVGRGRIRRNDENRPVTREDDYTRPGGDPLFYGVDRYSAPT